MIRNLARSVQSTAYSRLQHLTRSFTTTNNNMSDQYLCDLSPPICSLAIAAPFAGLTEREKMYAHHMSRACWNGSRIIMAQTTVEAESIFDFIMTLFSHPLETGSTAKSITMINLVDLKVKSGVSEEDFASIVSYSAQVLSNLSSFKSFGSVKFIPRCDLKAFEAVIKASPRSVEASVYWDKVSRFSFSMLPSFRCTPYTGHRAT
jgi:dipeptidyl-peptidase-3